MDCSSGRALFLLLISFLFPLVSLCSPIRIAHVVTYLKAAGGVEAQLYDLIRHLQKTEKFEHHVIYVAHDRLDTVNKIKALGIPVYRVQGLVKSKTPFPGPVLYSRFKKLIKRLKPDVIHSGLWTADMMSRFAGSALKIPVVCDIHADCHQLPWMWNWTDAQTAHLASRIVAVSKVAKQGFQEQVLKRMRAKSRQRFTNGDLKVVTNGVDVEKVVHDGTAAPLARSEIGLQEDDFVFGYVCHLTKNKGCDVLINAFAQLCKRNEMAAAVQGKKNLRLCIVGGGSLLTSLSALAKSLGIADKVVFMGHRSDPLRFYPLFDCYMMASHYEAISVALLEAMCFNLPIITTAHNGLHDVVQDSINGLTIPPGDEVKMSFAMQHVFLHQEEAQKMGNINRLLVQEKFSVKTKVKQYEELFEDMVRPHKHA